MARQHGLNGSQMVQPMPTDGLPESFRPMQMLLNYAMVDLTHASSGTLSGGIITIIVSAHATA